MRWPTTSLRSRRGAARPLLACGQQVAEINARGLQVVDTRVFNADDLTESMSMAHNRVGFIRLYPAVGGAFRDPFAALGVYRR